MPTQKNTFKTVFYGIRVPEWRRDVHQNGAVSLAVSQIGAGSPPARLPL
jgi:hypothetical protein